MNGENLREKLKEIRGYAIFFTNHAELRLVKRQIDKNMVISHLRNPDTLKLAEKIFVEKESEKYKLWFVPFKKIAFIYVIVIKRLEQKIIVVTVIKQRLDWQKTVERNA